MIATAPEIKSYENSLEVLNAIEIIAWESISPKELEQQLSSDLNYCA